MAVKSDIGLGLWYCIVAVLCPMIVQAVLPAGLTRFGSITGPAEGYATERGIYLTHKVPKDQILYKVELYFGSIQKNVWLQLWYKVEGRTDVYQLRHSMEVINPGVDKSIIQTMRTDGRCPLATGEVYLGLWSPDGNVPIPYKRNPEFNVWTDGYSSSDPPRIDLERKFEMMSKDWKFLLRGYVFPQPASSRRRKKRMPTGPSAPCPDPAATTTSPTTTTTTTTPKPPPGGGGGPPPASNQGPENNRTAMYIGIGVGAGVLLIIVIIVIVCCQRKRRSSRKSKEKKPRVKEIPPQPAYDNTAFVPHKNDYEQPKSYVQQPEPHEYMSMPPQPQRESGQYEEIPERSIYSRKKDWPNVLPPAPSQPRDYENTRISGDADYVDPSPSIGEYLQPTPYNTHSTSKHSPRTALKPKHSPKTALKPGASPKTAPKPSPKPNNYRNSPSEGYVDMNQKHNKMKQAGGPGNMANTAGREGNTASGQGNTAGGQGNTAGGQGNTASGQKKKESTYLELIG